MKINLKNPSDYNRAIQFLQLANVELYFNCRERELDVTTIEVTNIYNYTCPHCEEAYTEMGEELKIHYDSETGLIQCQCGKELKPLIRFAETAIPQLIKSTETEEEVLRLSFQENEYERVHELLRLAGIEAYDLEHIEQVVVYVNHGYEFNCPKCGSFYQYDAYEGDDLYCKHSPVENRFSCDYCGDKFKVRFKNDEHVVFE